MTDLQLHQVLHRETTPLYVFDLAALPQRVATLREHLPEGVGLCYAVKANPFLLSALNGVVERFEICSPGELVICQQAGLSPDQYVLSGVYKEPAAMGELVAQGEIGCYTVESMTQFSVLYGAALAARKPISLLLRLTSGNQFGMDQEEIRWILDHYGEDPCLDIRGIQYFSGTQKHSLKRLARELALVDQFLASLTPVHPLRELEFGPGFPVAYFPEDEMDEETFLTEFADLLRGLTFRGKITLELGRRRVRHLPYPGGGRQGEPGGKVCHCGRRHAPAGVLWPVHGHEAPPGAPPLPPGGGGAPALDPLRGPVYHQRHPGQAPALRGAGDRGRAGV